MLDADAAKHKPESVPWRMVSPYAREHIRENIHVFELRLWTRRLGKSFHALAEAVRDEVPPSFL
jgi:hypothetical protein